METDVRGNWLCPTTRPHGGLGVSVAWAPTRQFTHGEPRLRSVRTPLGWLFAAADVERLAAERRQQHEGGHDRAE